MKIKKKVYCGVCGSESVHFIVWAHCNVNGEVVPEEVAWDFGHEPPKSSGVGVTVTWCDVCDDERRLEAE